MCLATNYTNHANYHEFVEIRLISAIRGLVQFVARHLGSSLSPLALDSKVSSIVIVSSILQCRSNADSKEVLTVSPIILFTMTRRLIATALLLFVLCAACSRSHSTGSTYKVIRVADGDTITVLDSNSRQ